MEALAQLSLRGDIILWHVKCPYCSKTHKHGGGYSKSPDTLPAWRSSHCGKGEYKIDSVAR